MELFKLMTKTDITQVSYRGTAPAMTDIAAGVVDVMFTGPPSAMALATGGKVKMLAVASPARSSLMPQLPTVQEAGGRDTSWAGGSDCWRRPGRHRTSSIGLRARSGKRSPIPN
jgi:tripartite-type tricarboxylate transporter receptor subunit TctC